MNRESGISFGTAVCTERRPLWPNRPSSDANRDDQLSTSEDLDGTSSVHNVEGGDQQGGISHVVRGHLNLKHDNTIAVTAYRPSQASRVLTVHMVGSDTAVKDDHASVWFNGSAGFCSVGFETEGYQQVNKAILLR